MNKFISHFNESNKLYSVANAAAVLVQNATYETASAKLLEAGLSLTDATDLLNNPAPASEWFPTLLSAIQNTAAAVEENFETFASQYEAEKLTEQMEQLRALVVNATAQLQRASEWEATVLQLGDEIDRIREVVIAEDAYFDSERVEQLIYDTVLNTELGQRFLALQQAKRVA